MQEIDAVNDALGPLGVSINRLPLTPSNIWSAMRRADDRGGER